MHYMSTKEIKKDIKGEKRDIKELEKIIKHEKEELKELEKMKSRKHKDECGKMR